MSRRRPLVLMVIVAVAVPAFALGFASAPSPHDRVASLLRAIEAVPSPARLDEAAGPDGAADLLRSICDDELENLHARWHAIGALAAYPGGSTESRLRQIIDHGLGVRTGSPTLFARSAAFSLAQLAHGRAVPQIAPLLDHAVPDVRADAARALAIAGSPDALPALRARLQIEQSPMVRAEIVDAIRVVTP